MKNFANLHSPGHYSATTFVTRLGTKSYQVQSLCSASGEALDPSFAKAHLLMRRARPVKAKELARPEQIMGKLYAFDSCRSSLQELLAYTISADIL
jgi:hypothetical protein